MNLIKSTFSPLQQVFAATAIFAIICSLMYGVFPSAYAVSTPNVATINSVTVGGGSTVTVAPSASVSVGTNVTLSGKDWKATKYTVNSVDTCDLGPDYKDDGTSSNSFSISAPASAGSYSVTVSVYNGNSCVGAAEDSETLSNAIVVEVEEVNTPPVITLSGVTPVTVTQGDSYTDDGATAEDAEDGDISEDIVVGGDTVNTAVIDTYVITYNVEDSDGAEADEVTRTVNVVAEEVTTGTITIEKTLTKDNEVPGSETVDSFTYRIGEDEVEEGVATEVAAGSYTVSEDVFAGYEQSDWGGDCAADGSIEVVAGEDYICTITNDDEEINEALGSIAGSKFDFDTEDGLEGWTIFIDENDDQTLNGEELSTLTASDGSYLFSNLQPNGTYSVCEENQEGWTQMSPEGGCYSVELSGAAKHSTGNDFVNQEDEIVYGTLEVKKEIVGETDAVWSDFSFAVNEDASVDFDSEDGINQIVVPVGTYTVVEKPAEGFDVAYDNCNEVEVTAETTTTCTITNTVEEGGGGGDDDTTTLTVIKRVVNGTQPTSVDSESSDFMIDINVEGITAFAGSETGTIIELEPGTSYSVSEVGDPSGYDVLYSGDCETTITEGQDLVCTVTNDQDRYLITGYVWRDRDQDGEDDGGREVPVVGITIQATNGTDVITTTTNESGFYTLNVPEGTWVVTEADGDWRVTRTIFESYTIVAPEPDQEVTVKPMSIFARLVNVLIPTAHAAVIDTFANTNFGVQPVGGGGSSGSSASPAVAGASTSNTDAPAGEVLGESTSILPVGAPNTGAGGSAASPIVTLLSILGMFMSLVTFRFAKNV